ncbi:MAG: NAD(P)H-hydrate epimerase, partial [Candidatus Eisenbacteria bacterium]|nr:NAD(P)H-hydrate epimerase [Candidatus Eisenbacteria bacterium]
MRLVTADEVRSIDRATIESGHATGLALMDRAGHQVVAAMERRYGPLLALRVLVLCGTGNNGGDGLVAARALGRLGAKVRAVVLGDPQRLRGDALQCLEAARAAGVVIERADDEAALDRQLAACDAWDFAVDAMLGTGARGAPEGVIAAGVQALRELDERGTRVVAVDLPTGVDADSGAIARRAVRADLTVAFGFPKRGHWLYPGRAFVGALEVAEIGLAPQIAQPGASRIEVATASELAMLLPTRSPDTHKKRAGRVLVIGGAPGLTGAPVLAAR